MKEKLLCVCLLVLFINGWATEIQIGNGTLTEKSVPLKPKFNYSMSQTIYHQTDINVSGQEIESLKYAYAGANDWVEDNIKVYLGHTNKQVFDNNDDWIPIEDLSLVFNGQVEFIYSNWCEIIFDSHFFYNNTDNLVVAIEANTEGTVYSEHDFFSTRSTTLFNRTIYQYSNNVNGDFHQPPTGRVTDYSPSIKLDFSEPTELPQLYIYPYSYNWEDIDLGNYIEPLTVSLRNVAVSNLEITDMSLSGDDCFTFDSEVALPYLILEDNLNIFVDFIPQTEGVYSSQLDITFNNNVTESVFLHGNAIDREIYEEQYYVNFDDTLLNEIPEFWTSYINSSDFETNIVVSNVYYFDNRAISFIPGDDQNPEMFLFSPMVNNLADKRIRFMGRSKEISSALVIGTADKNHGDFTFTPRDTLLFTCGFEEYYHNFSSMMNNDQYIALKYYSEPAYHFLTLDDFHIESISSDPIFNLEVADYGYQPDYYNCGYAPLNRSGNTYLVVHNSGGSDLSLNFSSLSDNFQVTNEQIIIEPEKKKLIEVLFTPSVLEYNAGTIDISTNDPNLPQKSIYLKGYGVEADLENIATTGSNSDHFLCGWSQQTYNQAIYYPGEIGYHSAIIEEFGFRLFDEETAPDFNLQIFMGYTDKYYFDNANDWIDVNDLMEVYNGTFSQNIPATWHNIDLTTPFPYDDSQNLVISLLCDYGEENPGQFRWKASYNNQLVRTLEYIDNENQAFDIHNPPSADFIKPFAVDHRFGFAPLSVNAQLMINQFNNEFEDTEALQISEEKIVTVRSTGELTAIVYVAPVIYGEDADNFTISTDNNSYPYLLPYNERVNYGISFTPTSAGYKEAIFQIYDGETREIVEVSLSGMALAPTDNADTDVEAFITKLGSNYPNPFNPETSINYSIKESSDVEINIYNIRGQRVKSLINEFRDAGKHVIIWDGKDDSNKQVSSGVYLYQMKNKNHISTKKMILMK